MKTIMTKTVRIGLALFLLAITSQAAPITEPSTVFYGKVTGTGGAQPFAVTDGTLEWVILKADGSEMVLRAPLYPLNGGEYSYRLDVPHSALAYELDDTQGIPLPPSMETNVHVSATVDGLSAVFVGPSGSSFEAGQVIRAATYRLDLEIPRVPIDSDGDGIPDWWEDEFGFDKQNVTDASADADGDGLTNLDEYLYGLDPRFDSRAPTLASEVLLAYPGCLTGVRLVTDDIDSVATNIFYTLLEAPANGVLRMRNQLSDPTFPDLDLQAGAKFTQQDVDEGRLVFAHDTDPITNGLFVLRVRDETHAAVTGEVAVTFYDPPSVTPDALREQRQLRAYQKGYFFGSVVWDAMDEFNSVTLVAPSAGLTEQEYLDTYLPSFGNELGQMMTGGRADDELSGGMANDILVGGSGVDVLSGGGGADTFIFDETDLGEDTITDFNPEEGDVIDLSGVLSGESGLVDDYVQFSSGATNTVLALNLDGNGAVFTNLVVTLSNVQITDAGAYELILNGDVLAGDLTLMPRVTVVAGDAEASENGDNSGTFVVTRSGSLSSALTVTVSFGGSAENGIDYSSLNTTVSFAPGIREVTLTVDPFADSFVEPSETVQIVILPGSGYVLHNDTLASLTIYDLQAVVGVEVIEPLGTKDPLIPAMVLITRDGQTANSLGVRLDLAGSARNGADYQYVSTYVNFSAGQTEVLVNLLPLSGAVLSGGAETVLISVQANANYALADVADARVVLADRRDTLASWQAREFGGDTSPIDEFAALDLGDTGIDNLQRYAYGMDPLLPDHARLPQFVFRDGQVCLDIFRNPSAVDVEFIVEVSDDLKTWDSSPATLSKITAPEYENAADRETWQIMTPLEVTPKLFARVRLIYRP